MPPDSNKMVRIEFIVDRLVRRVPKRQIKKEWDEQFKMTAATFSSDISDARESMRALVSETIEDKIADAVLARKEIINSAWKAGYIKLALEGEKDLAELEGLYKREEKDNVKVVLNFGDYPTADSDEGPVSKEDIEEYRRRSDEEEDTL